MNSFDVIVAGGGAAGLSAAIFLGRAKLSVALFDNGESSLYRVSRINNYLGFPEGVGGGELLDLGKRQTERSGAVVIALRIDSIRVGESGFEITAESENYRSTYFIVASNKRTDLAAALDLPLGGHGNRFVSVDADGRPRRHHARLQPVRTPGRAPRRPRRCRVR